MTLSAILLFFEIILAPFILTLIAPQMIAAFFARSIGRSFWFWFWISFLIPVISIVILMNLPEKPEVPQVSTDQ
jgi:hypothetical protein